MQRAACEDIKAGADLIKIMANGGTASPPDPIAPLDFSREEISVLAEGTGHARQILCHGGNRTSVSAVSTVPARAKRRVPASRPAPSLAHTAYIAVVGLVLLFTFTPLIFVLWVSVFQNEVVTFPPQGYTLHWFANAWANPAFLNGFTTSVQIGLLSMVAGLALGIPASFALVRGRFPGREALNAFLLSPLIVPGIVAGTAIYIYFVQLELWTGVRVIATLPGFILAHVALTIPWTVRLVSANLLGVDRAIEEAAANLGARPFTTFWRITLPMIRPGVVAAGIFSFIVSFTDLEMSLFLVGPGRSTLQIAMLQYLEWKFDPTVAAASVVQIAITGLGLAVADRFVKLSKVV